MARSPRERATHPLFGTRSPDSTAPLRHPLWHGLELSEARQQSLHFYTSSYCESRFIFQGCYSCSFTLPVSSWSLPSISHLATPSTGYSGVGLLIGVLPCVESLLLAASCPFPALSLLLRLLRVFLKSSQSLPGAVIAFGSVTTRVRLFQNKSIHTPSVHNMQ